MLRCMTAWGMAVNVDSPRCMLTFTNHFGECYQLFQISHNVDIYQYLLYKCIYDKKYFHFRN